MSRTNDTQRHVSHVAWDPDKGFDMNNMDHDMQKLFQLVDIKLDGDVDKEIIDFVYDFVEKHGGIEAVKKEFGPGNAKSMPPLPLPTNRGNVTAAVPPPPPSCVGALAIARVAMNNMDHDMQKLFQSVDIKLDGDVDKEIIDFVYDFVEKHGGIEAVKKEFGPGNAKSMPPLPLPTNRGNVTAAVPPPPPSCVGALAIARVAMNNMDHDMQKLFQSVDIKLDGDVDKEIIDFVYDFVEKHGGIEAVKKEFGPGNAKSMPPLPPPTNRGNVTAAVPPPPPSHVGTPAIARVAMHNMDHDMQKLFQSVDIKLDGDVDKEIIDFVYDFVEKHGGIEAVKKEFGPGNAKSMPPLPPATNKGNITAAVLPLPPSHVGAPAVPRAAVLPHPPPSRGAPMAPRRMAPPPPSRVMPPPPSRTSAMAPQPPPSSMPTPPPPPPSVSAAPPSGPSAPPPPPPPPLPTDFSGGQRTDRS